jgi:hypothetical protein
MSCLCIPFSFFLCGQKTGPHSMEIILHHGHFMITQ